MDVTAVIIRTVDYGEKDRLVTLACTDGLRTARVRGVRSSSSKLKAFTGLLSFGEFSLTEGRGGYTVTGASITDSFYNCWTDAERNLAAMAVLEIFEKIASAGEYPDFIGLLKTLNKINYGQFYPLSEALRFGVVCGTEAGMDVSGEVFPEKIKAVFLSLLSSEGAEEILTEYTREEIKTLFKHLASGYNSDLGIKLTVFAML